MIVCELAWPLALSGGTSTHGRTPACKHSSICMLWCQHKYTVHVTHICAHTQYTLHFFPPEHPPFFAHTETNTCYTHTVNLTPCSNAERIVPGLGDIKSLDYPIKSYSTPSPTYAKSVEQTIAPHHEGRGKCAYVNVSVHALFGTWIKLQSWINVIFLVSFFLAIKTLEGNTPQMFPQTEI